MTREVFGRPIILLGPTRSGKSMIAKVLAATGRYARLKEPITIWDIGRPWFGQRDDCRSAAEATPAVIRRIRRALTAGLDGTDVDQFVDDLPHHVFRLDFCRAVVPEARFILVARDARHTVAAMKYGWLYRDSLGEVMRRRVAGSEKRRSIRLSRLPLAGMRWTINHVRRRLGWRKSRWGPTAPGQLEFGRSHTLVETVAYQWAQMAQHAFDGSQRLPADRVTRVRYEDLFARRDDAIHAIASIAQLPGALVAEAAEKIVDPGMDESGLLLPEAEWRSVEPIVAPMQRAMGYAADQPGFLATSTR
jgi:hypothetical protein